MDAITVLKSRKSVRKFLDKEVSDEILNDILDCGRLASSAKNIQPWRFVVIKNKDILNALTEVCTNGKFLNLAPVVIGVFCEKGDFAIEDGSAATQNILLAATAHGLGGCWVAGCNRSYETQVGQLLNAPDNLRLITLIPIGYFDNKFGRAPKKPLSEIVSYEHF